jgi:hypothetical protein
VVAGWSRGDNRQRQSRNDEKPSHGRTSRRVHCNAVGV